MALPVSSCFLIRVPQLHSSRSLSHPSGITRYSQFIPEIHGVTDTMALEVCRWFLCWTLWCKILVIFCHNGLRVGKSPLKSGTASESSGKWCFKKLLFLICDLLQIFHLSSSQFWLSNTCISEMLTNTQTQAAWRAQILLQEQVNVPVHEKQSCSSPQGPLWWYRKNQRGVFLVFEGFPSMAH